MEMTTIDGKNPRIFLTVPTADGRWMVAFAVNGALTIMPEFLGSCEDAEAVAAYRNQQEMAKYAGGKNA